MLIIRRRTLVYVGLSLMFILGFVLTILSYRPRVMIEGHRIFVNPRVRLAEDKVYRIRLWDCDLNTPDGSNNYHSFIKLAINRFQRLHPNIKVELRLYDLSDGPAMLDQAFKQAPSSGCLLFGIYVTGIQF